MRRSFRVKKFQVKNWTDIDSVIHQVGRERVARIRVYRNWVDARSVGKVLSWKVEDGPDLPGQTWNHLLIDSRVRRIPSRLRRDNEAVIPKP